MTQEESRLQEARKGTFNWKKWGPYLSERQWGTVREDYSEGGDAWNFFTHDQARSRAYRWGEDGIAGIADDKQRLFTVTSQRIRLKSFLKAESQRRQALRGIWLPVKAGSSAKPQPHIEQTLDFRPHHTQVKPLRSGRRHGRKKSGAIRVLERALRKIDRFMPNGGTLPEWCARLEGNEAKFEVPAPGRQNCRLIEYVDAIRDPRYYDRIRKRFKRILGPKLVRQFATSGQNRSRSD